MFSSAKRSSSYATVGLESRVLGASPVGLVVMLYDGAIEAIDRAVALDEAGDQVQRGRLVGRACAIITEGLRVSLNKQAGGAIAENLDQLYDYMTRTLLTASSRRDMDAIRSVRALLQELRDTWNSIEAPTAGARPGATTGRPGGAHAAGAFAAAQPTAPRRVLTA
ncbi:flagellar export chaperone FliS [Derxia gummosa]|uniref:Flagellar export chaperone FliS n=1 Tax=Derxia gummosa DSM 723 TaxID=1121388 RepID=A0A8B6XA79_9BURK|nr:flagellar export chaperone FliS [Derxia gummosa]